MSSTPGAARKRSLFLLAALILWPAAARGHEDDPKLRDRRPPFAGPGFRPGALRRPGLPSGSALLSGDGPSVAFAAQGVQLLSWLTLADFGGMSSGNDCWGYVSPSGREYALVGLSGGTAFVEITDPSDPQIVDVVAGPPSLWRDVKVYDHYAYAVSEGGSGIQVIDLAQIDAGQVTHVNTVTSGGTTATHNVAIDVASGFLYRTGGDNRGLRAYRLTNPANPVYVGSWNSRYVHDAQVVTYTSGPFAGRQIAFCCGGFNGGYGDTGLSIVDVTNKSNMFQIAQLSYPGPRYSHQAWLSPDRQLIYLNDELDENGTLPTTTHVIDVSDINSPFSVGTFTNGSKAIGHNLYTQGDRIFEANYRSGLRVFDASDPLQPAETAWFDVWPGDDYPAFNGLWSVYPYFPSGVVIGSDLEKGLFVWWVGDPPLAFDYPQGRSEALDPAGASLEVRVTEARPGTLAPGSATLHVDAGAGQVELALVPLGGDLYRADFPPAVCGEELAWYVSARTLGGAAWTDPPQAPYATYAARAALSVPVAFEDDMETDTGWTVGDPEDDATEGFWLRGDPFATVAQPEDDHSPGGTRCWYTGWGALDVDGRTTLTSPRLDLAAVLDPSVSFWRWFSDREGIPSGADRLVIEVSDDDGASWVDVETVNGPGASIGLWVYHSFRLTDFVERTDAVRVRFVVYDLPIDSTVEAAIDDVRVTGAACDCDLDGVPDDEDPPDCNGNGLPDSCDVAAGTSEDRNGDGIPDECACAVAPYCTAVVNSSGAPAALGWSGSTSVAADDLVLAASPVPPGQNGLMIYSPDAIEVPLGDGNLCVGSATLGYVLRLPFEVSGPGGVLSHAVDLAQPPASAGQVLPGSTWCFQAWFRDVPAAGAGFNFSAGLAITFCP